MKPKAPPLEVQTPCSKRWEELQGGSQHRYCDQCQLHVHNLSTMSSRERERFVARSGSGPQCIAYELRPDGSMVTASWWASLLRPFQQVRWATLTFLAAFLPFAFSSCATRRATLGRFSPKCDPPAKSAPVKQQNNMIVGTMCPKPANDAPR
ncbi:MAG TPA: hypothetical protein VK961_05060 [Chthoniobacter sp.]|nr:hypothetical protein [Chthoniobacter sp.]